MTFFAGPRYTLMDYKLELVPFIPVTDVDRAKNFYLDNMGFVLIVDTPIGDGHGSSRSSRPARSARSASAPGSPRPRPARPRACTWSCPISSRRAPSWPGAAWPIGPVRHMESGQWVDGPHPERENYQSFADFADPDGNVWLLQEVDRSKG